MVVCGLVRSQSHMVQPINTTSKVSIRAHTGQTSITTSISLGPQQRLHIGIGFISYKIWVNCTGMSSGARFEALAELVFMACSNLIGIFLPSSYCYLNYVGDTVPTNFIINLNPIFPPYAKCVK